MLNYYNITFNFNHDNLDDTKILHFVDHMQKEYITHWKHSLSIYKSLNFVIFLKAGINHRFILMLQEKILIIVNLTLKQAGMTRFRGVIEFVLFVASTLSV